jgi:hypothetical protein
MLFIAFFTIQLWCLLQSTTGVEKQLLAKRQPLAIAKGKNKL